MDHWEIVIVFIFAMLFYDDSIIISKKFIQTLVCAITITTHAILIGCTMDAQWMRNGGKTWYHCLDNENGIQSWAIVVILLYEVFEIK